MVFDAERLSSTPAEAWFNLDWQIFETNRHVPQYNEHIKFAPNGSTSSGGSCSRPQTLATSPRRIGELSPGL